MVETVFGAAAEQRGAGCAPQVELELASIVPRQAKTVRDTGLEPRLITELVVKAVEAGGKTPLPALSNKLKLSISVLREVLGALVAEQQVEVAWCGESDIDVQYQLTAPGQRAAAEYLARSQYVGPAPVTLAAYRAMVERQSLRRPAAERITPALLAAGLGDDGLDPGLRELIGAALHSNRALLLHGPSGSGKTTLAAKLGRLLPGVVALPYAILVERQIIQFYDPLCHLAAPPRQGRAQEDRRSLDGRWAICRRPLVHVGAELTRDMLDLRHDALNGVYHAPPQFQANNGVFIVDDVGRQRVPAAELLKRWIGPLDHGVDQLSLQGGHSETVPFDATLVFATNLVPATVFDEAFMRRIGYKIPVGALSEASYRSLWRRQCRSHGLEPDDDSVDFLLAQLHRRAGCPLLASYPQELLGRIVDFAGFAGQPPRLSAAALEQAWTSMFASCSTSAQAIPDCAAILSGE
jgi:energy-coupling factor transporter ATP-binding protein EcfA2